MAFWSRMCLVALAPLLLAIGNCQGCTLIGCYSTVTLTISGGGLDGRSGAIEATMCVDDSCADWGRDPDVSSTVEIDALGPDLVATMRLPGDDFPGDHTVSLDWRVDDSPGIQAGGTVELTPHRPNGERCEPTCWVGQLTIDAPSNN